MNKGSRQDRCCDTRSQQGDHRKGICPLNSQKGQTVDSETLRHLLKEKRRSDIKETGYYFCKASDCDTVYFHSESGQYFEKKDLNVRVGLKEGEDPVWLCYCFDISQAMMTQEMEDTSKSSFSDRIRREVAAENCACEIKNPSGRCCLGEVMAAEKEIGGRHEPGIGKQNDRD